MIFGLKDSVSKRHKVYGRSVWVDCYIHGGRATVRRDVVFPLVPVHLVGDVWFAAIKDVDRTDIGFNDYITETWVESDVTQFNH